MAVSRKGRPALGLQTLIDRLSKRKTASAPVSYDEAQYARHVLEKNREAGRNFRDATLVGTFGNPARRIIGNAVKGAVNGGPQGRWRGAVAAVGKDFTTGQIASDAIQGGVVGAGLKTMQEGLGVGRAKRTANRYLQQNPEAAKMAGKSIGKQRIMKTVTEVWGKTHPFHRAAMGAADTIRVPHEARRLAAANPLHGAHVPFSAAARPKPKATVSQVAPRHSRSPGDSALRQLGSGSSEGAALARPHQASPTPGKKPNLKLLVGGGLALGGAAATNGNSDEQPKTKFAASLTRLADKVIKPSPLPTTKMAPMIDGDVDYEL